MSRTIHPAAFLSGAIAFCALWLWLQPEGPQIDLASTPRGGARPARASIQVDPAILERYVGHYEGRADFTVDLSIKDGRLYAKSPATVSFEMLATSETEFFLKESPDIGVKFRVDGRSTVTGFDATTPYGPVSVNRTR
jgi:hypothetical protein